MKRNKNILGMQELSFSTTTNGVVCFSTYKVLEYGKKRKRRTLVCCPKIHAAGEECDCTLEETIAYNKKFGHLPKAIKKFKVLA